MKTAAAVWSKQLNVDYAGRGAYRISAVFNERKVQIIAKDCKAITFYRSRFSAKWKPAARFLLKKLKEKSSSLSRNSNDLY
jgi:hypothetical protein